MKKDKLTNALGMLDDDLIAEYQQRNEKKARRTAVLRISALAACFCLIVSSVFAAIQINNHKKASVSPTGESSCGESDNETEPLGDFKILNITAEKTNGDLIAADTRFIVECENGTVNRVREHIFISGGPEYTVEKTDTENCYAVTLSNHLSSASTVQVSYVENSAIEYSWAFQTETSLQVSGTYPANYATGIDRNTVLEIEFSGVITSDISEFVKTEPEIKGTWEYIGRMVRLSPSEPLAENETYTVTVSKGLKSSESTLESDYTFSISTSPGEQARFIRPLTITEDKINSYTDGQDVTVFFGSNNNVTESTVNAKVEKFSSAADMRSYAEGNTNVTLTEYGKKSGIQTEIYDYHTAFDIPLNFDCGYYVAHIYDENECFLFDWIIQVNQLSAYLAVTEKDIIVWVSDSERLLSDVRVEYKGEEYKTDANGVAYLENVCTGNDEFGYVNIGTEELPLTVGVRNFAENNNIRSYVYTDKTMYKPNDTIHVWGCVPLKAFSEINGKEFTLVLGDDEQTLTVTPDENGAFEAEFKLTNHIGSDYTSVNLKYDDNTLYHRYVQIQDYHLQNYIYELKSDKNYVYAGENYEFDVLVTHISGVKVKGKRMQVKYNGNLYDSVTGEDGYAHFSLPTEAAPHYVSFYNQVSCVGFNVYSGDIEEDADHTLRQSNSFYVINSDIYCELEENDKKLLLSSHKIVTDGVKEISFDGSENNITGDAVSTSATVHINLIKETKTEKSKTYNEYTKRYEIEYDYNTCVEKYNTINVEITNGEAEVDLSTYSLPTPTETEKYRYQYYVIIDNPNKSGTVPTAVESDTKTLYTNYYKHPVYSLYEYSLEAEYNRDGFSIGQSVNVTLTNRDDEAITDGRVLRLLYKDKILSSDILSPNSLSVTINEDMYPQVYISGAYYKDGHFYRLASSSIYIDHKDKNIDIEIEKDKEIYSPGEQVTLSVTTKDSKGNPVSCAANISVVNEAVFNACPDYDEEPPYSYGAGYRKFYSYSSYRSGAMVPFEGGCGGGDGPNDVNATIRKSFDDTACFKTVQTDRDGKAKVTFTLPDNVCEYRITTHAVMDGIYTGCSRHSLTARMDFFIQSSPPNKVKSSDDLVLNANSILESGIENVSFTFALKETGFCETVTALSGSNTSVKVGKLPVGTYTASISAVCGEYNDAIEYQFEIINSAQQIVKQEEFSPSDVPVITPSALPVTLEIYNTQTQRYIKYFDYLESNYNERLDTIVCNREAAIEKKRLLGEDSLSFAVNHYLIGQYIGKNCLLSCLPEGEGSPVMTALYNYYMSPPTGKERNYNYFLKNVHTNLDYFRYLLYCAASGDSVLLDLRYAKDKIGDDEYCKALMSCAFAFVGDYTSAKEIYGTMTGDCEDEDYAALRIIAATFIDRENASAMIDEIIADKPYTLYLPFAVLSYIKNNIPDIKRTDTVNVSCGAFSREITVNGIEIKEVKINEKDLSDINFETPSDNILIRATYQTDYTVDTTDGTGDITASISGDTGKYQIAYLNLDLSRLPVRCGRIRVALPNCFRYIGTGDCGNHVSITANADSLAVNVGEKAPEIIQIPLIIKNEGNYVIEPVVFTSSEGIFRSDSFEFTAE